MTGVHFARVDGKHDSAEAFRRDLPTAHIERLDTGHFALETHANALVSFLADSR